MSLLHRRPKPLAPEERTFRDDRLIVVVTEDTYAPEQYFAFIRARRVRIRIAPSQGGHTSPQAILASARALRREAEFKDYDEFWLLLDVDHWTQGQHRGNFSTTIDEARREGMHVAVSNPCFDLWLLLHHDAALVPGRAELPSGKAVAQRYRELKGVFNKARLDPSHYTVESAREAIARGKALTPDLRAHIPPNPGTQVWALAEQALAHAHSGA